MQQNVRTKTEWLSYSPIILFLCAIILFLFQKKNYPGRAI